jgi:hypothetical protein
MSAQEAARVVFELDHAASSFLDVLVEAGYLDEKLLERVSDCLLDLEPEDGIVDGQTLRRVAAEVLFDAMDTLPEEARRVLETEWPVLFH